MFLYDCAGFTAQNALVRQLMLHLEADIMVKIKHTDDRHIAIRLSQ
jgi:hypothetical protein